MTTRRLFLTAAVLAAIGLAFVLWGSDRGYMQSDGVHVLGPDASRRAVVDLFGRADALEVCTRDWPGEDYLHVVDILRRQDDPKRWEAWTSGVAAYHSDNMRDLCPSLIVRFLAGGKELAVAGCVLEKSVMLVHSTPRETARVTYASSLNELLQAYAKRVADEPMPRWLVEFQKQPPARIPVVQPPAQSFEEAKARLVKLFPDCDYVTVSPFEGRVSVASGEGQAAWQQMTRAMESADRSRLSAIPEPPEVIIGALVRPGGTVRSAGLAFSGGELGCIDRYYGNGHLLRPGPGFTEGLQRLQALAKAEEEAWQREHHDQPEKEAQVLPQPAPAPSALLPGLRRNILPRAHSFQEAKGRLVNLLHDCDFVNLAPNGGGVSVRSGEGQAAWQQMTRAVEKAKEGWAIPGNPEVMISIIINRPPGRTVRVGYSGGQLGCGAEDFYGGSSRSVQPGPEFAEGLRRLQAAAKAYEGQFEDEMRRRREYHKRTGKVLP